MDLKRNYWCSMKFVLQNPNIKSNNQYNNKNEK